MDIYSVLRRWSLWGGRARTAGGATGQVLELGIGGGANLPYYASDLRLVGLDPQPTALAQAARLAQGARFPVVLVRAQAEALPFLDGSLATVTGTLVFCSVDDPAAALREVRRVLRPGGELRLVEHIRPEHGPLRYLISLLASLWFRFSRECHIDRDTFRSIQATGFAVRQVRTHAGGLLVEVVAENPRRFPKSR